MYLLEGTVCGVQYIGSTCTPFRLRFENYKACSRKFNSGASVPQMEFFRRFTEEGHHGFLKAICVKIIDRLTGEIRCGNASGSICWIALPLNTRQVDTEPGSKGRLPTSVLTLVPARSNSQFDWLFDNKRLSNYSKELLLGFGEKLINFGSLSRKNRTKD